MTTQSFSAQPAAFRPTFLHRVLLVNGLSSALIALALIVAPEPIATFVGGVAAWVLVIVGLLLLPFAAVVYWLSRQPVLDRRAVQVIFVADVAWVVGSIALVAFGLVDFTPAGRWAVILVADAVALFALGEWWGLRKLGQLAQEEV
jgi:hypothetical protein